MMEIKNLHKNFGDLEVLKGIDMTVEEGEKIVIIGPSGSGKSTLLRCMNNLEVPTEGDVIFQGIKINDEKTDIDKLREDVGMVFQSFNLFSNYNILENLTLAPVKRSKMSEEEAIEKARKLLKRIGLEDKEKAYPKQLSGGQKQRVAIIRALMMEPSLLLFDEPTSALDPLTVNEVLQLMEDLADEGMTMVVVTHEMNFAKNVASRIIFMDNGKIIEESSNPQEFFKKPTSKKAEDFLAKIH